MEDKTKIYDKDIIKCIRFSNKFAVDTMMSNLLLSDTEITLLKHIAYNNLTQEQIAECMDYSCRQVNRILKRVIGKIRNLIIKYEKLNPELKTVVEIIFFP